MDKLESNDKNTVDEAEDLEKLLTVVVRRRKTLPNKLMEFHRRINAVELTRLENSVVYLPDKNTGRENFKRISQGIKKSRYIKFSLEDLNIAEKKLLKYFERVKEINAYLMKAKQGVQDIQSIANNS